MPTGRKQHRSPPTARRPAYRRVAVAAVTVIAAVAVLTGTSLAVPVAPEPTLEQVRVEVEGLFDDMEVAAEAYNDAALLADEVRGRLTTLRANLAGLQSELASAASAAGVIAAAQYRGAGLDPVLQMIFLADDGSRLLDRLSQLHQLADQQASTVGVLTDARAAVALQETSIQRETARLDEITAALATTRAEAEAKHRDAQALLDQLTAEEEARLAAELAAAEAAAAAAAASADAAAAARFAAQVPGDAPPTGPRAAVAVAYALAQLGDAYVWGAEGPDSYDCSGLTMMAWAAAGVSLPHSAAAQNGYGSPVTVAELQPGDLVFYKSPISHVAMYIGNSQIVHASNPLRPIGIAAVDSMPISGTRRVG